MKEPVEWRLDEWAKGWGYAGQECAPGSVGCIINLAREAIALLRRQQILPMLKYTKDERRVALDALQKDMDKFLDGEP